MLATIGLVLDVAIILVLVIFAIIGLKKGFLHQVLSLFSWVVCILVAILVAKYVAGWINGIYNFSGLIGGKIEESLVKINEFFSMAVNAEVFAGNPDNIINSIPEGTNGVLAQIIKLVFKNSAVDMTTDQTIASFVGSSLGHISMVIISGVLVFIVLMIVVALLKKLFNKISKTKILGGLNKILGLALGLIKAAVIVIAVNCLLVGLSLIPAVNKTITPIIQDNTKIEKFIYNKTDEIVEKNIIEGEVLQDWITSLWEAR